MQKFHSKMTPRSLYTQFPLTEITYAKVCSSVLDLLCLNDMYSKWSLSLDSKLNDRKIKCIFMKKIKDVPHKIQLTSQL